MEITRKDFSRTVGIPCLVVLGIICICATVSINAISSFGRFLISPFLRAPREMTLYQALRSGREASFALGTPCTFSSTTGTEFDTSSQADVTRDIEDVVVIDEAEKYLHSITLITRDGKIRLMNGTPISISFPKDDQVYLSFEERQTTGRGYSVQSLQGVAEGNTFQGKLYRTSSLSDVIEGQGVERSVTFQAEFNCKLDLISAE